MDSPSQYFFFLLLKPVPSFAGVMETGLSSTYLTFILVKEQSCAWKTETKTASEQFIGAYLEPLWCQGAGYHCPLPLKSKK